MKFYYSIIIVSLFAFQTQGFAFNSKTHTISGKTMGTFYTIKFISHENESSSLWKKKVDTLLEEVNKKMSMYDPKSELSLFNLHGVESPVKVSPDFFSILVTAKDLYSLTKGAWDGTVKPLVDLWGFGTKKQKDFIPGDDVIGKILPQVGFAHIELKPPHTIVKRRPVTLDLGSIAKGYGVDAVASMFKTSGINNVLVEIGGELHALGKNIHGKPWSVGISRPDKDYTRQGLYKIIHLNDQSIATSGNYRNFFEKAGKTFSHIIDPKTGYPVNNYIVSASVVSKNCTFADGLATALMVMDAQAGINLVDSLENTECLIIQKNKDKFISLESQGFKALLIN